MQAMTLTPASQPRKESSSHPHEPLCIGCSCYGFYHSSSPFTLHFTADIISQISAHLVRILTDFDGLGEKSHPSCYKLAFYQTLLLIKAALVLNSHVPVNHC